MRKRTGVSLAIAGLIVGLVVGSIGIASAVSSSISVSRTAPGGANDFGGGRGLRGAVGPGGLATTVSMLTGISVDEVMTERQAGKSYEAIAKPKGVSASEIVSRALKDARQRLDAEVKAGRMTSAQEKQLLAEMKTRFETEVKSTAAVPARGVRGMRGGGELASAVASLTGMSVDDVMTQRQAGKSFAAIAKAKGVSADDVVAKALKDATAELKTRLESEVDATGRMGPGGRLGGRGNGAFGGGDFGSAPNDVSSSTPSTY